jgi:hypothetical protein
MAKLNAESSQSLENVLSDHADIEDYPHSRGWWGITGTLEARHFGPEVGAEAHVAGMKRRLRGHLTAKWREFP